MRLTLGTISIVALKKKKRDYKFKLTTPIITVF